MVPSYVYLVESSRGFVGFEFSRKSDSCSFSLHFPFFFCPSVSTPCSKLLRCSGAQKWCCLLVSSTLVLERAALTNGNMRVSPGTVENERVCQ